MKRSGNKGVKEKIIVEEKVQDGKEVYDKIDEVNEEVVIDLNTSNKVNMRVNED